MTDHDARAEAELLRRVDDALTAGAVTELDPDDRALQELALALAAETPEPDPVYAAELAERVRAGFPRGSRGRSLRKRIARRLPTLRRPSMPVMAGVATALAAVAVATPLILEDGDRAASGGSAATGGGPEPPPASADDLTTLAPRRPESGAMPPAAGGAFAPGEGERRIERTAALTLAAPAARLDQVADDIASITDRYNGFVLRSSLTTGDRGTTGGEFELRVPSKRLPVALTALSELGKVRQRSQTGDDVTGELRSTTDQLQTAQAQRRSLLRRLERADSDSETESLRGQLDLNAGEISGLKRQLRDVRLRTDYATVSVDLEQHRDQDSATAGRDSDGLRPAVDDALGSLSDSAELVIRALGVALPLALLATLLGLAGRQVRRRRREAALL